MNFRKVYTLNYVVIYKRCENVTKRSRRQLICTNFPIIKKYLNNKSVIFLNTQNEFD